MKHSIQEHTQPRRQRQKLQRSALISLFDCLGYLEENKKMPLYLRNLVWIRDSSCGSVENDKGGRDSIHSPLPKL